MMRFSHYVRQYYRAGTFCASIILCCVYGILPAVQIRLQSSVIDQAVTGISGGDGAGFFFSLSLYILILAASSIISVLLLRNSQQHNHNTGLRLDTCRVEKSNLIRFDITETSQFHTLLEQARNAPSLDSKLYQAMEIVLSVGITMISSVIVLLWIDYWTVIGIMLLLAVSVWLNIALAKKTDGFWNRYIDNMRFTNYLASLLLQREYSAERKLFAYGDEIGNRFKKEFNGAKRQNQKLGQGRLKIETILELFSALYSVTVVLLLLRPLSVGTISIGSFTAAFYAANALRKSCSQLYGAIFTASGSWKQMTPYFSFMQLPEEICTMHQMDSSPITIQFKDVSFAYPGETTPVLEHISFTMTAGKHYALVGENGCGKTTLAKLLVGLYTPTQGEILVGGKVLQSLPQEEKQKVFSAVLRAKFSTIMSAPPKSKNRFFIAPSRQSRRTSPNTS